MRALQRRFGVGEIIERLERCPASTWRISRTADVYAVLRTIRPYLTHARESVRQALDKLDQIGASEQQRQYRDREIVALWLRGQSKNSIAQALGVPYPVVTEAIGRFDRGPVPPSESTGPMATRREVRGDEPIVGRANFVFV